MGSGWGSTHGWVFVRLPKLHPNGSGLYEHLEGPGWGLALGRHGEEGEVNGLCSLRGTEPPVCAAPGLQRGRWAP